MEIEIAMDRQLVAQHALIIYGYEKDPRYEEPANSVDHYITKHRVDGEGRLLEGAPLTKEMLHNICSLVMPSLRAMEYIPEKVLAYSPGTAILWWTPSVSRRVFFAKETGLRSGAYPLPATLFLVVNRVLHTWALATTVRPEPSTPIYHSPFFNVYEGGTCCMGNIELPRNASPGDIDDWEKAFFDGACNGHIAPKLQGIEPYELWKAIEGKTEFPKEYLIPCGIVEDIIKSAAERRASWTQI
jgi:PRTRC genetic system protein B